MSITKTQSIHERRNHFPGYLETKNQVAFSSNNPFRANSSGGESSLSPFEDHDELLFDRSSFKSASVGDLHDTRVMQAPIERTGSSSPRGFSR